MGRAFEYRRAAKEKRWDKMSKLFPKLAKAITVAAKEGGGDPDRRRATNDHLHLEIHTTPGDEVDISLLGKLMRYLKHHRGLAGICLGLTLVQAALMALPAYAIGLAVDVVRSGGQARDTGGLIVFGWRRVSRERPWHSTMDGFFRGFPLNFLCLDMA